MRNKVNLLKDTGEVVNAEIINSLAVNTSGNNYMMYTLNEIDSSGLIKVYACKVIGNAEPYALVKIEEENEWTAIKDIMRNIIAGEVNNIAYNDFNYNQSRLEDSKVILLPADAVNNNMTNAYLNRVQAPVNEPVTAQATPALEQVAVAPEPQSAVPLEQPVVAVENSPLQEAIPLTTPPAEIPLQEAPQVVVAPVEAVPVAVTNEQSVPTSIPQPFSSVNLEPAVPQATAVEAAPVAPVATSLQVDNADTTITNIDDAILALKEAVETFGGIAKQQVIGYKETVDAQIMSIEEIKKELDNQSRDLKAKEALLIDRQKVLQTNEAQATITANQTPIPAPVTQESVPVTSGPVLTLVPPGGVAPSTPGNVVPVPMPAAAEVKPAA